MGVLIVCKDALFTEDNVFDHIQIKEPEIPEDPKTIADYPVTDGLKGLYDLGGTAEASLVNHAPEPHVNTAAEKLEGSYVVDENFITFSGATNTSRMSTYLRLQLEDGITAVTLFKVPTGARVLVGNRSGSDTAGASGTNLRNDGVEFWKDGVHSTNTFTAINSNNFAILAMTASEGGLRVVRYTNGALNELYDFEGDIVPWSSNTNAIQIAGYSKPGNAKADADIALTAIHTGVLTDPQLESICEFVKKYGEQKGLTIE